MRVELVRSGGFANVRFCASVDDGQLGEGERDELIALVEASGVWSIPAAAPSRGAAPDRFRYRLTVDDGDRRCEVTVGEEDLPDALRPLVEWLDARARPSPAAPPPGRR
jgi:hypothetical protein